MCAVYLCGVYAVYLPIMSFCCLFYAFFILVQFPFFTFVINCSVDHSVYDHSVDHCSVDHI